MEDNSHSLSDTQILWVLKKVRREFDKEKDSRGYPFPGLCFPVSWELRHILGEPVLLRKISEYIPEFTPEFLLGRPHDDIGFWWPTEDDEPRKKALDRLISIYEDKVKKERYDNI